MSDCQEVLQSLGTNFAPSPHLYWDAAFLLTVGSFLLTVELFLLTVDNFSFSTHSWSFFAYNSIFFTYSWSFFAYSGKVRLISALRDCKQRGLTVSKKAATVSKKASPFVLSAREENCIGGGSGRPNRRRDVRSPELPPFACKCYTKPSDKRGFWNQFRTPSRKVLEPHFLQLGLLELLLTVKAGLCLKGRGAAANLRALVQNGPYQSRLYFSPGVPHGF